MALECWRDDFDVVEVSEIVIHPAQSDGHGVNALKVVWVLVPDETCDLIGQLVSHRDAFY